MGDLAVIRPATAWVIAWRRPSCSSLVRGLLFGLVIPPVGGVRDDRLKVMAPASGEIRVGVRQPVESRRQTGWRTVDGWRRKARHTHSIRAAIPRGTRVGLRARPS